MSVLKRRKVLKLLAGLPLLTTYQSISSNKNATLSEEILDELKKVNIAWHQNKNGCPMAFIDSLPFDLTGRDNLSMLKIQIKQEFSMGNVLKVNGLVISKTEAALLTCTSEICLKTS